MEDQKQPPTTETSVTHLADRVRSRRKSLGLRQADLADLAGCGVRFVHMVENGKATLRLDKVLDVLEVLGLELVVRRKGDRSGSGPSGARVGKQP